MRRRQENQLVKPLGVRVMEGTFSEATNPRVLVSVVSGAAGHEERDVFLAPTVSGFRVQRPRAPRLPRLPLPSHPIALLARLPCSDIACMHCR